MIGPDAVRGARTRFDRDLVRKYDRPGPRYTSYPTAHHFTDGFGPERFAGLLDRSAAAGAPLSLYVHVPFCDTRCLFCGCNVEVARDRQRARRYLGSVEQEMERVARRLARAASDPEEQGDEGSRAVVQVHWGGGTPTFLPAEDLAALMASIRRHFRLATDCEISIEVDPRHLSEEQLDALAAAGANRLSLGVQDLAPRVLRAVRRAQPVELVRRAVEGARRRGMRALNFDLIYGLPHQTPASFLATLRELLDLAPDRLAVYSFAYLPAFFRHQRAIAAETLPAPEAKLAMLEMAVAELSAHGYVYIGMDHFAKPEDSLARALAAGTLTRNFQGYSTVAGADLVGFGASAISALAGGYAQNPRTSGEYTAALERGEFATCRGLELTAEDRLRRDVILQLLCRFRVDKQAIAARHGIDFDTHFAAALAALEEMAADGLVELRPEAVVVTSVGRFLVRNAAMAFDARLDERVGARSSRTV